MVTLADGTVIPTPADQPPVLLPEDVVMDGIQSPIKADKEWAKTQVNGQDALRETDTFDTFMESSWYYARYCSPHGTEMSILLKLTTGYQSISTLAASNTLVCICCISASSISCYVMRVWLILTSQPRMLTQGGVVYALLHQSKGACVWVSPLHDQQIKTTVAVLPKPLTNILQRAALYWHGARWFRCCLSTVTF